VGAVGGGNDRRGAASSAGKPSCVIVVENLPVPFDRRVWQEARALRNAGWAVSVICPATEDYPLLTETIEGIEVFRHPLPVEANGKIGFLAEYAVALFHELRLLFRIWRRSGITVIQGCNPPDLIFLVAAPFKLLGTRFVFDHHDICPELFEVKFQRRGLLHRALLLCEWLTFRTADAVISTNETFCELAMSRGGVPGDRIVSVYSYPDRTHLHRVAPDSELRGGRKIVLGYVGIIGAQDGVDHLIHATRHLIDLGYDDLKTVIVGDGPAAGALRTLATELGIQDHVTFTGYRRDQALLTALSTFDIAVIPDPANVYNDKISMNKVFEYATLGIPTVAYKLTETMRLFADAALYADNDGPQALAAKIRLLIDDTYLRAQMAERAVARATAIFDWNHESKKYVAVFDRIAGREPMPQTAAPALEASPRL
jgi:glycosyltransferase involved in cell wall biosynthesis